MKLMLSYGMNCNSQQMRYRCPQAKSLGRFDLANHRLVFRGYADAVESPGDTLQTVLWEITDECELSLDILEGYPSFYTKKYINVIINGHRETVMMYHMLPEYDWISSPTDQYRVMLEDGYYEHGLELDQIYDAEGFWAIEEAYNV